MSEQMYYHTITGKIDSIERFDASEHSDMVPIHHSSTESIESCTDVECVACGRTIQAHVPMLASVLYNEDNTIIAHVDHLCIECE